MVIIDAVINTLLGKLTLDPAGMQTVCCMPDTDVPSWDDAFVSNYYYFWLTSTKPVGTKTLLILSFLCRKFFSVFYMT